MKKEIQINPTAGQVFVNVKVLGQVGAGYTLKVFEANSNDVVLDYSGNNVYDHDDLRKVSGPAQLNIGRVIMLDVAVTSLGEDGEYELVLEVIQDQQVVDTAQLESEVSNETKMHLILVKLI